MKNKRYRQGRLWLVTTMVLMLFISVEAQPKEGLFYAVVKKGSVDTSYLLGTIHSYPGDVLRVSCEAKRALKKCKQLCLEIHSNWQMALQVFTKPTQNSTEEKDFFTPEEWEIVKQWLIENHKMEEKDFAGSLSTSSPYGLLNYFLKATNSKPQEMESELTMLAKNEGLKVKGLDKDIQEIGL